MEIQSAFNAGVQGLQRATEEANEAATNIARQSAPEQVDELSSANTAQNSAVPADLSQSVVDLKVAEFQAKASKEVIQSADESLGTLLDVRV